MKRRKFIQSMTALGTGLLLRPFSASSQQPPAAANPHIKRVLAMFKCHFDAGFIDTQNNVVHKYMDVYFPQAIALTAAQRASGADPYVWTTGSWLVYEYLEQASGAARKQMEEALGQGDIAWHALPFTWQSELLDASADRRMPRPIQIT